MQKLVDLIRAYSNRTDLRDDLRRATQRLERAAGELHTEPVSVSTTARVGRKWALTERLSEEDVRGLVEGFRTGTPKHKLAKRYDISVSSVKRILRLHRAAKFIVREQIEAL